MDPRGQPPDAGGSREDRQRGLQAVPAVRPPALIRAGSTSRRRLDRHARARRRSGDRRHGVRRQPRRRFAGGRGLERSLHRAAHQRHELAERPPGRAGRGPAGAGRGGGRSGDRDRRGGPRRGHHPRPTRRGLPGGERARDRETGPSLDRVGCLPLRPGEQPRGPGSGPARAVG